MAVALSVLLGNLRLLELPNGGSIAFATLPLLALAATRGVRIGLLAGLCAGAAHALAGGTIVHPIQLVLDYVVSYAALAAVALTGRPTRARLAVGTVLAMSLHLAAMVVSGVVFFAPVVGDGAFAYSLGYNAATVVPELVIALWLLPTLVRAMARANPTEAVRRGLVDAPPARSPARRHPAPKQPRPGVSADVSIPIAAPIAHVAPRPGAPTFSTPGLRRPAPFAPTTRGPQHAGPVGIVHRPGGWLEARSPN